MGQAGSHLTHGADPADMHEFGLMLPALLFRGAHLGDIPPIQIDIFQFQHRRHQKRDDLSSEIDFILFVQPILHSIEIQVPPVERQGLSSITPPILQQRSLAVLA